MDTGEKAGQGSEEYVIKAIHNITEQLNYIKTFYKNKGSLEEINSKSEVKEIIEVQDSIQNLVSDLVTKPAEDEIASYQLVPDVKDNNTLVISEKTGKVFLPYTVKELKAYLEEYPEQYKSLSDVVNQEYILPLQNFKSEKTSRFKETYCLMRDIEMKSIIESFKKAVQIMFNSKLNPAIISACKSEEQLDKYIYCAEHNKLEDFTAFKIVFDAVPLNLSLETNLTEEYFKKKRRKNKGRHNY